MQNKYPGQSAVNKHFGNINGKYDLMNNLMSLYSHIYWKKMFVNQMHIKDGHSIVDMAGGSGDIVKIIKDQYPACSLKIALCDINNDMLELGRHKLNQANYSDIDYFCYDASCTEFKDNDFNTYSVSFGLRNFAERELSIKEAYRILKPNGFYYCMEFNNPNEADIPKLLYKIYLRKIIPLMGSVVANNWDAYEYFGKSIDDFIYSEEIIQFLKQNSFRNITKKKYFMGIFSIIKAQK